MDWTRFGNRSATAVDASRIGGRGGAFVMATLRDLLLGLMELQRDRGQTQARTFPGWRRKPTMTRASPNGVDEAANC